MVSELTATAIGQLADASAEGIRPPNDLLWGCCARQRATAKALYYIRVQLTQGQNGNFDLRVQESTRGAGIDSGAGVSQNILVFHAYAR